MKPLTEDEYNKKRAWGLLTSIDLFDCDPVIMKDKEAVKKYVAELCAILDVKRFGECVVVHFGEDPRVNGFSMTQLIETSLVSGHFANQSKSIYIDIFSCKFYNQEKAIRFTQEFFKAKKIKVNILLRGVGF